MTSLTKKPLDRQARINEYFIWAEFIRDEDKDPVDFVLNNLRKLANAMALWRRKGGIFCRNPIIITSGYRTPAYNRQVGGRQHSYHILGMAADFTVVDVPAREVQRRLTNWHGGLGAYETWTHTDIRPYRARWSG
jgi:zinc D-Ala-D-Ala carboxypeptidase